MIVPTLLSFEVQSFIRQHEQDDPHQLVLRHPGIEGVPISVIAEQIIGRRKAREKIPAIYATDKIVYPPGVNLEQCSSEATALFKSNVLFTESCGKSSLADLTGGFGVDSYFFSKVFHQVYYVEPDTSLLEIVTHNFEQLKANGVICHHTTAEAFLSTSDQIFDCVYIDPSRRDIQNRKVSSFAECNPNVIHLLPEIFRKSNLLLVKASPLLDIQQGVKELSCVKMIFVLSVENECKELLFLCEKNFEGEPIIGAINLSKNNTIDSFYFKYTEERLAKASFSDPLGYLFEPNASILKAGAFKLVSERFNVAKLHPNTHLFTADTLVENFPGKVFKIVSQVKPDPKMLQAFFPDAKANLTTRNYPLSVKELKAKTKLMDGGNKFLIGFSGIQKRFLVVAERIT
jgi:hypothetical protein